jgi:hypothetical protein
MKERLDQRIIPGTVLIGMGTLFLLQNLGFFQGGVTILWSALLGGAGITALYFYAANREHWWALIPGSTLIGIALSMLFGVAFPRLSDSIGGALVLGGIATGFWLIYLTTRSATHSHWWAVIPAGVLSSLAITSALDAVMNTEGLFLVGLGLTFILITQLPDHDLRWGYIPGGILTLIGILNTVAFEGIFNILWPLALIGVGGYVIVKNFKN